jgi:hypothetical protein
MSGVIRVGFSLALVVASVALLTAQDDKKKKKEDATTRIVKGTVVDSEDKPVVGAVVRLKDVRGIRSFITRENGSYTFTGLRIDTDYELQASFNGVSSSWKRLSVFDERKDPVMNLKLDKKAP